MLSIDFVVFFFFTKSKVKGEREILDTECHSESLTLTPRLAIASLSNCTTSSPTTSEQLKPLVHLTRIPFVKPSCCSGNENVKPNGNRSAYTLCSYRWGLFEIIEIVLILLNNKSHLAVHHKRLPSWNLINIRQYDQTIEHRCLT